MFWKKTILALGFFVLMPATFSKTKTAKNDILLWDLLLLKDSIKPGDAAKLKAIQGKVFRIPGFMIPLEVEKDSTGEFLLVPTLPACAHVPPPPPSQTILVKMGKKRAPISWDPIWVNGKISIKEGKQKMYGEASFEMEATGVQILKPEDMNEIAKLLPQPTYVPDCNGRDKFEPVCQQNLGGTGKGKK